MCCRCISSCCYSFFVEPVVEGKKHFGKAFKSIKPFEPETGCCEKLGRTLKGLVGRVAHFGAGILFLIPILNKILLVAKRCIYPIPKEPVNKEQNIPLSSQEKNNVDPDEPEETQDSDAKSIDYTVYKAYGKKWLDINSMSDYFLMISHDYPELMPMQDYYCKIPAIGTLHDNEVDALPVFEKALIEARNEGKVFASYMRVSGNHWTFVFIDPKNERIEYYDSMGAYGNYKEICTTLTELAARHHFTFESKIKRKLQHNSYDCGPWVVYFLEQRLENPNIDTDTLATGNMKEYRKTLCKRSHHLVELKKKRNCESKALFQQKYGKEKGEELFIDLQHSPYEGMTGTELLTAQMKDVLNHNLLQPPEDA